MKKGSNEKRIAQDHAVRTRSPFCLNRYHLKTDDLDEINGPSDNVDFDETHRTVTQDSNKSDSSPSPPSYAVFEDEYGNLVNPALNVTSGFITNHL
ncbi:hypothetical protein WUBG_00579 [Wuchereria bancrofti]|uniref:Uncharacterized protein n=1 Tax=Wuchereria bancrofti TaxID=6293 RepID=J9FFU5_WUCBA|nr:hypothetical protein WUBG_00579 [Wuchereria bancrofti]